MRKNISEKKNLRKILSKKRDFIKHNCKSEFSIIAFNKLIDSIDFYVIKNVGSFVSIRSEISTILLNKKIIDLSKTLSFPKIENNSNELVFKKFFSNQNLKLGKFNIPEPPQESSEVFPELFFVPCLGFDLNGFRIGYGGGFYDKTFAKLKQINHKFYTVGFAFDDQKVDKLPIEKFDYKLDFVLTEKQLYTFI